MASQYTIRAEKAYQAERDALIGRRVKAQISYERSITGVIAKLHSCGSYNDVIITGDDGREYYVQSDRVDFITEACK